MSPPLPYRLPWLVVVPAAGLVALGLLGIARCEEFNGMPGRYFWQQAAWAVLALGVAASVCQVHHRVLGRWAYAIFLLSLLLLLAVYGFAPVNGARRWIRLAGLGFQPSELAKVACVLALARYLMHRDNYRTLPGLIAPLLLTLVPLLLVLKEPDLGTAMVFLPVLMVMLFAAGARGRHLACCVLAGLLLLPVLWTQMSREQKSRVTALLDQTSAGQTPRDDTYQLHQAKQMLALGGVWGSALAGPSVTDPAAYYLPEARSDFIFCVLGERFGLWGVALVLALYGLLVAGAYRIAVETREPLARLTAAGLAALFAVEVLINTGMTVGLLPVTGLSLPLVSYGGSGLVVHALALGLLVNIGLRPGYEVSREPFRFAEA
jgi:cell division protein FtsW (lipid II flippase)